MSRPSTVARAPYFEKSVSHQLVRTSTGTPIETPDAW